MNASSSVSSVHSKRRWWFGGNIATFERTVNLVADGHGVLNQPLEEGFHLHLEVVNHGLDLSLHVGSQGFDLLLHVGGNGLHLFLDLSDHGLQLGLLVLQEGPVEKNTIVNHRVQRCRV